MKTTRRAIGVVAMLAVLATGWALEKSYSYSHGRDAAAVMEPAQASAEPLTSAPVGGPATVEWEYDRSDLLLSQG
jgi:hypothetical protein